jgi:aminoglycoside 3-N-acetyltransferase
VHPQTSFAALGPAAEQITADHPLDSCLGERSPIGRVNELDGDVLLLGAGHDSNTSLHLAEYRSQIAPFVNFGASVRRPGAAVGSPNESVWTTWRDRDVDADDFGALGVDLDATGMVLTGIVGLASCRLMRQRVAVDFATPWLAANRAH